MKQKALPWQIAKCSLKYKHKRHPLVITVEYVLFIVAAKPMANAAVVKLRIVKVRVVRGCEGVGLLHEAVGLKDLNEAVGLKNGITFKHGLEEPSLKKKVFLGDLSQICLQR